LTPPEVANPTGFVAQQPQPLPRWSPFRVWWGPQPVSPPTQGRRELVGQGQTNPPPGQQSFVPFHTSTGREPGVQGPGNLPPTQQPFVPFHTSTGREPIGQRHGNPPPGQQPFVPFHTSTGREPGVQGPGNLPPTQHGREHVGRR
jgi:hypothetical protein